MQQQPAHLQPVEILNGIGAQTALRLQKLGIFNLQDLLFHLPLRYQDRSRITPIASLQAGDSVLVLGKIEHIDVNQRGRSSLICRIADDSGSLTLRFFYFNVHQTQRLKPGVQIGCYGEVRVGYYGLEMVHPDYKLVNNHEQLIESSLIPVYPLTDGLNQSTLRKLIRQALDICLNTQPGIADYLPACIRHEYAFADINTALLNLHRPDPALPEEQARLALNRLVFEEFLAHHLALAQNRLNTKKQCAPIFNQANVELSAFIDNLPFTLTNAQRRVIHEIATDCSQSQPMQRLLQGDVGSGKTVIAAVCALLALSNDWQVAVMAPTELLAEQHFRNFSSWFKNFRFTLQYLSGQQKGKVREQILTALVAGETDILIGTHALFQDNVHFHRLGLIIIDEQHRFGVNQRLALRAKGQQQGLTPHQLTMTATPIPRTLAMLQYSDLDVSILDELPPGRQPVITSVLSAERRQQVVDRIAQWVKQGRQAYWVCTLIEESELLQCEAAEKTAAVLSDLLPEVRIGLVHGRMKNADKDTVMQAFKHAECDLLVATTVIEVGVDVPNAGLMIIENPERLGLAQLHQLRGRIGRGNQQSYCLLLYQAPLSMIAKQRLSILKHSNNGFDIAEKDLQLRGPGEVLGTRQTGQISFKIADLNRDHEILALIPAAAAQLLAQCPQNAQPLIQRWLGQGQQYAEV